MTIRWQIIVALAAIVKVDVEMLFLESYCWLVISKIETWNDDEESAPIIW